MSILEGPFGGGVIWWSTLTGVIFFVAGEGGRPGPRFLTALVLSSTAPAPAPLGRVAREARAAAAAALLARLLLVGGR